MPNYIVFQDIWFQAQFLKSFAKLWFDKILIEFLFLMYVENLARGIFVLQNSRVKIILPKLKFAKDPMCW